MKIHSYQHNNPRYNAPTAKITSWFGLVTKEYFFKVTYDGPNWFCVSTGKKVPILSNLREKLSGMRRVHDTMNNI